jgi:hypothetical protein
MPGELALAQAGIGAIQAGIGLFGLNKKKKAADEALAKIETYSADPRVEAMYKQAQLDAQTGLGGAESAAIKQAGDEASAAAVGAASGTKGKVLAGQTAAKIKQKTGTELAVKGEAARRANRGAARQLGMATSAERAKAFQSRQDKESLGYQKSLSELAATRASIAQGLSAIGGGAANVAMSGSNPFSFLKKTKGMGSQIEAD